MRFTKILCPTDFSPGSERAVRTAVRLAAEHRAELVLAHVWHIPPSGFTLEAPFAARVAQQIADEARRDLDVAVHEAGAARGMLGMGAPWAEIVALLEQEAFDLCVIGTHGRTGLARILLGSVAEKVVRHAPCSVLVVRPDGELGPFAHVLVPTDFSHYAQRAIELAPRLVAPGGALTLLHVVEDVAQTPRATAALDDAATRLRASTAAAVATRVRVGYPGGQILATIDFDPTIDLAVTGSHGRTGIERVLMGSVAEKVVRHARCPVLVAR